MAIRKYPSAKAAGLIAAAALLVPTGVAVEAANAAPGPRAAATNVADAPEQRKAKKKKSAKQCKPKNSSKKAKKKAKKCKAKLKAKQAAAKAKAAKPVPKPVAVHPTTAKLLTVGDLGAGWQQADVSAEKKTITDGIAVDPANCMIHSTTLPGALYSDERVFRKGGGMLDPAFGQTVAQFANPAAAIAAFDQLKAHADACGDVDVTAPSPFGSGSVNVAVRVTPLALPTYGEQSAAYSVNASMGLLGGHGEVVMIRKGAFITVVAHGQTGTAPRTLTTAAAAKAAAKL